MVGAVLITIAFVAVGLAVKTRGVDRLDAWVDAREEASKRRREDASR